MTGTGQQEKELCVKVDTIRAREKIIDRGSGSQPHGEEPGQGRYPYTPDQEEAAGEADHAPSCRVALRDHRRRPCCRGSVFVDNLDKGSRPLMFFLIPAPSIAMSENPCSTVIAVLVIQSFLCVLFAPQPGSHEHIAELTPPPVIEH